MPTRTARILPAAVAALALAPVPADARRPSVAWRAPDQGARVSGLLAGDGCQIGVRARSGVRRIGVRVQRMRPRRGIVRRPAAQVELREVWRGRYVCVWNTTAVRNARYRLTVLVRTRAGRRLIDRVVVRVRNPTPPSAPEKPTPVTPVEPPPAEVPGPKPEGCTPMAFPTVLHSDPPSAAGGDVSRAFVDAKGCKVPFSGFNMFPAPGNPPRAGWDARHYHEIRAKGFTALRFLVTWQFFEPKKGAPVGLQHLDRAIVQARQAGLYVIVTLVHIDRYNAPPVWTSGVDEIARIETGAKPWIQALAARYRHEPTVAAYDLVTELPTFDPVRVLKTYAAVIGWVRAVDPDKVLLIEAPFGNARMTPAVADPRLLPDRRNVVHSTHDYFAGDGNPAKVFDGYGPHGGNAGNQTWTGEGGYPNTGDQADFDAQLQHQMGWARQADVPFLIGEFGINWKTANARAWAAQKAQLYDRYKLGRFWWLYACDDRLGIRAPNCAWKDLAAEID